MPNLPNPGDEETIEVRVLQGTAEWKQKRLGRVTASRIADVMAKGRSGAPSASRESYLGQLVTERLTNIPHEGFKSSAMEWGTVTEPEARAAYEFYRNVPVELVDFVDHPTVLMSGCSPDGFVGETGMVQFKCPSSHTHIETLLGGKIARGYMLQMQWEMACTKRLWCDFVSFDPRMPEEMRLHITRVQRDPATVVEITTAVCGFLSDVEETVRKLTQLYRATAEAAE